MDALIRSAEPTAEAARRLRGVQRAMSRMAALDSVARVVAAAPREVCRAIGFERAMMSHIRGDRLSFASAHYEREPALVADFGRLARAVRPRLDRCAPEHEAVIRQMPVLVRDAQHAAGVFKPLVHVARTPAYVVAPIVREGHTVGLLHADTFGVEHVLDELDRELLWTFATGLGWTMDGLATRSLRQPAGAEPGDGREPLDELLPGPSAREAAPGPLSTLTSREQEVLRLLAEGASNAAIGEKLVISQATVKSHVRHILRKLGAANRTEAVSLYLVLAGARASRARSSV